MSELHRAFLSLGSNIEPESNLVTAIERLQEYGRIEKISDAWESRSVGAPGPNFLNACVLLITSMEQHELKTQALRPIEAHLGRRRSEDKFAPRTMDIDIVIFDGKPCADKYWEQAFVVVPLAEIHPTYRNPLTRETLTETATRLRHETWMEARRGVLSPLGGSNSSA